MYIVPLEQPLPYQPYRLLVERLDAEAGENVAVDLGGSETPEQAAKQLERQIAAFRKRGFQCEPDGACFYTACKWDEAAGEDPVLLNVVVANLAQAR